MLFIKKNKHTDWHGNSFSTTVTRLLLESICLWDEISRQIMDMDDDENEDPLPLLMTTVAILLVLCFLQTVSRSIDACSETPAKNSEMELDWEDSGRDENVFHYLLCSLILRGKS